MTTSCSVLLVEDSLGDATLVSSLLARDARVSAHVETLEDALEALEDASPDVVLLDLTLPDSTGLDSLRAVLAATRSPVVVLTGVGDHGLAREAVRWGAQDYLDKSDLDAHELRRALDYAVERSSAQRALEASGRYRSLGLMASGLAHDFNNMIMAISGFAELALYEDPAGKSASELNEILKVTESARHLTGQLLAYVGNRTEGRGELDLGEHLAQRAELFSSLASSHGVELRLQLPEEAVIVKVGTREFEQAVINLLENAVEACAGTPQARVELRVALQTLPADAVHACPVRAAGAGEGLYAVLEVQDTGPGITPGVAQTMFDPFFSTKAAGRGLGLAVVQGVARSNGGLVQVESSRKGLRVGLGFPGRRAPRATPAAPIDDQGALSAEHPILVIDDSTQVLEVVSRLLGTLGLPAETSLERLEGLGRIAARPQGYAAVIMDLTMPGCPLGAEEFLRRAEALAPQLPVILSSGYAERELAEAIRAQCPFLPKPYTRAELHPILGRVLAAAQRPQA